MTAYNVMPDLKNRTEILDGLCRKYDFIRRFSIGKSLCKNDIEALHIGGASNRILYCGGFHGSEYLTVLAMLKFAEECAQAVCCCRPPEEGGMGDFLKIRGITIVPCVNPDGVEIAINGAQAVGEFSRVVTRMGADARKWKANARGVDINHNFNAGWHELRKREIQSGITGPAPTRFGGAHPESEPETRALTRLCRKSGFERAVALHSQGREIYCSYGRHTPVLSFRLASAFSQASGYNIAFPEEIATGGGFKDWFIECFRRPALTVEMGLGENPLPLSDFEEEYKILRSILCLGVVI